MKLRSRSMRTLAVGVAAVFTLTIGVAQGVETTRAQVSAGVLQRALADNGSHFETAGFPDYGLTLDAVLAMDSAGVGDYRSEKATTYVADHLAGYIGDGTKEKYAGATAKSLLVALSQQVTPKGTLGGVDLVQRLESLEDGDGRFADVSDFGDFSNTIGQSLALVSLKRAGAGPDSSAAFFLERQQCPNGGFRVQMADARCTRASAADTDATSYAVQAMLASPRTTARNNRIRNAARYLTTQTGSDGGVKGGAPTNTPNANSTGMASLSFESAGYPKWGERTRGWLLGMRFGCGFAPDIRGAVAYDKARRSDAKADGSQAKLIDQDRRSTAQAVLGLSGVSLLDITNEGARFSSPTPKCS